MTDTTSTYRLDASGRLVVGWPQGSLETLASKAVNDYTFPPSPGSAGS